MNYQKAREFVKEAGKNGSIYGLDSIKSLMSRLGNVHRQLSILHAAGTNGKGSVCTMLAQILAAQGYKTGQYASPAVFHPLEIIKINGAAVSKEQFAQAAGDVRAACAQMTQEGLAHPTAFEIETAIAFCCFQREACDFVVLETGLGGELDATNVTEHPVCSILTSISRDHMAILGDTLQEIAAAKAGIIKPGCPCVTAVQPSEVMEVLQKAAAQKGSMLRIADARLFLSRFSYSAQGSAFETGKSSSQQAGGLLPPDLCGLQGTLALAGACQKQNLACVLAAVSLLREKGIRITADAVLKGLAGACLAGRFEKIGTGPDFYIDGAHNEGAALLLRETVQGCLAGRRLVYIIGMLADKEYEKVLRVMLPLASRVFTVTPDNPRALDGKLLAEKAAQLCADAAYVPDICDAAALARRAAGTGGAVLAFGSFFYLGDLKQAVMDNG